MNTLTGAKTVRQGFFGQSFEEVKPFVDANYRTRTGTYRRLMAARPLTSPSSSLPFGRDFPFLYKRPHLCSEEDPSWMRTMLPGHGNARRR